LPPECRDPPRQRGFAQSDPHGPSQQDIKYVIISSGVRHVEAILPHAVTVVRSRIARVVSSNIQRKIQRQRNSNMSGSRRTRLKSNFSEVHWQLEDKLPESSWHSRLHNLKLAMIYRCRMRIVILKVTRSSHTSTGNRTLVRTVCMGRACTRAGDRWFCGGSPEQGSRLEAVTMDAVK
jgi:hypothetical protein